jgi:hypothetical protein
MKASFKECLIAFAGSFWKHNRSISLLLFLLGEKTPAVTVKHAALMRNRAMARYTKLDFPTRRGAFAFTKNKAGLVMPQVLHKDDITSACP